MYSPFLLVSLLLGSAHGFAPQPSPLFSSLARRRLDPRAASINFWSTPSSNSTTTSDNTQNSNNNNNDAVLRQLEKKESVLAAQRDKLASQLSQYETDLQQIVATRQQYVAKIDTTVPTTFTETIVRSIVKALCWRVVAGSITFLTTLRFSHSWRMALSVVVADFGTKACTMFVGERLMNRSTAGRTSGADAASRSLIKALVWRLFAIINTLCFCAFVSKDWSVAGKIASTDAVFKTALMFGYERLWSGVEWGKEYSVEFSI